MKEKELIYKAIEDKKQNMISEYNKMIDKVMEEQNLPELYYLLAQIFHNTKEQGELGITLLKSQLKNDFFKKLNSHNDANFITFSNDDFMISFSKSLSKEIQVKFKKGTISGDYYPSINKSILELKELLEIYLNEKTFKNFKNLADFNCKNYHNNIIATVSKYYTTYKTCNEKLLEEINKRQELDNKNKVNFEKRKKEYEDMQTYAKDIIASLTDLEEFKKKGWHVRYIGIEDERGCITFA
ncbi:MAG: hypothetical protein K0R54_241 [Clostridiaceae bacterium]|nr:hypothetical protein [Clostridiaceae bacterium]